MMILDKLRENEHLIAQVGLMALARAKEAGAPAYYSDPSLGEGYIKEMPDGRRFLVTIEDGIETIKAEFGPRG
ncbi:hypothetical protein ASG43_04640 [Aureimonas sp. Leaf454]|uniref:hypothetical protein n=1 Tax=Aureimonas sp. Leaf454 TaxID=1736381 RepID=UPI0006FD0967|nr:hypothetical protein [Aureimonas sp. Leaf454]KQT54838.1 hypothetical protein ASG43_04640 [Aureimonas sp. Leaf454]